MLGEVRHPEPVGGSEVPLGAVREQWAARVPPRHPVVAAAMDSGEPRHAFPAAGDALAESQLGVDPGRPVDPTGPGLVHTLDPVR